MSYRKRPRRLPNNETGIVPTRPPHHRRFRSFANAGYRQALVTYLTALEQSRLAVGNTDLPWVPSAQVGTVAFTYLMYSECSRMFETSKPVHTRLRFFAGILLPLALLFGSAVAQSSAEAPQQPRQIPGAGVSVQEQAPSPKPPQPESTAVESPRPISKAQAKELFRSVDEILEFVSHDSGLAIHHKVKRKLITREQVEKYVAAQMKSDKDVQRLEREELVLKKFGMVPRDYDLHTRFLKLLGEQVAAYYDAKTKTVNLLDWVQPELQRPVLAHELTHALQDQAVGLQQWLRAGEKGDDSLPDQQEQVIEEEQAARENVAEGQAMVTMLDYILAPAGVDVVKAPDSVDAMRASMTEGKDLPELASAPTYLRESLMMPYTFGLDFARAVLIKKGKAAAFPGMLEHPPVDTLQIMVPDAYLENKTAAALDIPDLNKLIAPDYERYDFGGMGAFDVYLLTKQYAPDKDAKQYYSHWQGGYYLAAHAKTTPKDQIALIYVSRWDSPESALAFAKMYGDYVPSRYKGAVRLPASCPASDQPSECSTRDWDTSEGRVSIDLHGTDLLIMESLNQPTMERVRAALLPDSQRH